MCKLFLVYHNYYHMKTFRNISKVSKEKTISTQNDVQCNKWHLKVAKNEQQQNK